MPLSAVHVRGYVLYFLDEFTKLRVATVSFAIPVCLSVRVEVLRGH
jgi:hypothetical protein